MGLTQCVRAGGKALLLSDNVDDSDSRWANWCVRGGVCVQGGRVVCTGRGVWVSVEEGCVCVDTPPCKIHTADTRRHLPFCHGRLHSESLRVLLRDYIVYVRPYALRVYSE